MGNSVARYDAIAEWYPPWVGGDPGLVCEHIASELVGQRWLDVACGSGRTSRELARRGASVIGVDLSSRLIELARASHVDGDAGAYLAAEVARTAEWWDGVSFDGAVCEMAFMDIDDLAGTLSTTAAALRPGAPFVVSMVNPCFPGNDAGLSSWPPDEGYTAEGFWTSDRHNPEGVRLRVGSNHRMLSTYLNALIAAGFVLERFHEPPTPVPTWLVIVARRSGSGS